MILPCSLALSEAALLPLPAPHLTQSGDIMSPEFLLSVVTLVLPEWVLGPAYSLSGILDVNFAVIVIIIDVIVDKDNVGKVIVDLISIWLVDTDIVFKW